MTSPDDVDWPAELARLRVTRIRQGFASLFVLAVVAVFSALGWFYDLDWMVAAVPVIVVVHLGASAIVFRRATGRLLGDP